VAWASALERADGPSALCLARQYLPRLVDASRSRDVRRGGYVLSDMDGAEAVILATGSEVALACAAQAELALEGIATRVVSMPCTNRFDRQPQAYQDEVLPPDMPAMAVEAAHPDFWRKYVGRGGSVIGIATFGESAPAKDLYAHFGITSERIVDEVRRLARRPDRALGRAGAGAAAVPA
jgi:transketolase